MENLEVENTPERRRDDTPAKGSILAVVVLYGMSPRESATLRTLQKSILLSQSMGKFKILIYDNTPGGHSLEMNSNDYAYHVSNANIGLAGAYNYALQMAEEEGFEWLLTLDQDTELTREYVGRLFQLVQRLSPDNRVAAIVPCVVDQGMIISPHANFLGFAWEFPKRFEGLSERETAAINSATSWRVTTLRAIGGFNPLFWLDYLDYWVCHSIHHLGQRIYVDSNLVIDHQLSLLDKNNRMKKDRYANFLGAESAFYDLYKTRTEGFLLTLRIGCRMLKQIVRCENAQFRSLTWDSLKRRLLMSRQARTEDWRCKIGPSG
ncbi:MAG TPA: glycosyltransferase [Acidisarcina sp.]|nr:glycosyltransferase [Acidisarcina sp.]